MFDAIAEVASGDFVELLEVEGRIDGIVYVSGPP
jgi:hypothetical protein